MMLSNKHNASNLRKLLSEIKLNSFVLIMCCSMMATVAVVWATKQEATCSADTREFAYMVAKRQVANQDVTTRFDPKTKLWCLVK